MPIYIKPVTFRLSDIAQYGDRNPTHGNCDRCGRDGGLDSTLVMTLHDQAVAMHICGHCGQRTEVMKIVVSEMSCKPVITPDATLQASRIASER